MKGIRSSGNKRKEQAQERLWGQNCLEWLMGFWHQNTIRSNNKHLNITFGCSSWSLRHDIFFSDHILYIDSSLYFHHSKACLHSPESYNSKKKTTIAGENYKSYDYTRSMFQCYVNNCQNSKIDGLNPVNHSMRLWPKSPKKQEVGEGFIFWRKIVLSLSGNSALSC